MPNDEKWNGFNESCFYNCIVIFKVPEENLNENVTLVKALKKQAVWCTCDTCL